MSHAAFLPPDLGSFCRRDELGLQVVGQRLEPGRAVLACRVVETDARWCRRCGCEAAPRDSVTRRLAHEPLGGADDVAGHDPPLSPHWLWACVAPGHQPGRPDIRRAAALLREGQAVRRRREKLVALATEAPPSSKRLLDEALVAVQRLTDDLAHHQRVEQQRLRNVLLSGRR